MKFQQVQNGEWVYPKRRGYLMKCCDCGLVHKMNFRLVKRGNKNIILFQAFRVNKRKRKNIKNK